MIRNIQIQISQNRNNTLQAVCDRYDLSEEEIVNVTLNNLLQKFEGGMMQFTGDLNQDIASFDDSIESLNARIASCTNSIHKTSMKNRALLLKLSSRK